MNKQLLSVFVGLSVLLAPLSVESAGTISADDSIAGLGVSVRLSGFGTGSAELMVRSPSGRSATPIPVTLKATETSLHIPGSFTEEAGLYDLTLSRGQTTLGSTRFEILADRLDPVRSHIVLDRPSIRADGKDEAIATVILSDRFGNLLSGRPTELIASRSGDSVRALTRETDQRGQQHFSIRSSQAGLLSVRALDLLSQEVLDQHAELSVGNQTSWGGPYDSYSPYSNQPTTQRYQAQIIPDSYAQDFDLIDTFDITVDPPSLKVGEVASITVRAVDRNKLTVENYVGTVRITAPDDPDASLPGFGDGYGEVTFTPKNLGQKLLPLVLSFSQGGAQRLVVEDRTDPRRIIRGETVVMVEGSTGAGARKIEITSHQQDSAVNTTNIVLEGKGPPYLNLLVTGGIEDAIGETDAEGRFSIPLSLSPTQRDFTLRVRDDTGKYDSGSLHLVLDQDAPEIGTITFSPAEPEEESNVLAVVNAEPDLAEVTITINKKTFSLSPDPKKPGTYQGLFEAPKAGAYQPSVVTKDDAGNKKEVRAQLLVTPKALPIVKNVKAEARANAVALSWDDIGNTDVTAYRIYVAEGDDKTNFPYSIDTQSAVTSATIVGLKAGGLYHFGVTALAGENRESSEKSALVSARPLGILLTVTPTDSALTLEWAFDPKTVDQLSSFILEYGVEPTSFTEKRLLNSKMTTTTVRDLIPGIAYYLKLTPVAISGSPLTDLTATGQGTPTGAGFHASAPDGPAFKPDDLAPPPLHGGAPKTTDSGLPTVAWWIAGLISILAIGMHIYRRKQLRQMKEFLALVQNQYRR